MSNNNTVLHSWHLNTSAIRCMSCVRSKADHAVNAWCDDREWLVLFLCFGCMLKCSRSTLQEFLGAKRIHQREMKQDVREKEMVEV